MLESFWDNNYRRHHKWPLIRDKNDLEGPSARRVPGKDWGCRQIFDKELQCQCDWFMGRALSTHSMSAGTQLLDETFVSKM